jgi:hypothetical protein
MREGDSPSFWDKIFLSFVHIRILRGRSDLRDVGPESEALYYDNICVYINI